VLSTVIVPPCASTSPFVMKTRARVPAASHAPVASGGSSSRGKQAELRASSLARFPEENPDPVLRLDRDLVVLYANDAALIRLAPVGVAVATRAPNALADVAREAVRERRRRKAELTAGGSVFLLSVVPVGDEVNVYAQDITARKAAGEALRASEAKYRSLFENMTEEVHLWELVREAGRIKTWKLVDVSVSTLSDGAASEVLREFPFPVPACCRARGKRKREVLSCRRGGSRRRTARGGRQR
jgi:PAS domain-containing protein